LAWRIEYEDRAVKALDRLDPHNREQIIRYLDTKVLSAQNPRQFGKALQGSMKGLWRYRVGDYRIVCQIRDDRLIVLVVAVGHRRLVYQ
jgi:mRNA interferase RelE/StbE